MSKQAKKSHPSPAKHPVLLVAVDVSASELVVALTTKIYKLATEIGLPVLKDLGYASKAAFQECKLGQLRTVP